MAAIEKFEDIEAWQKARELTRGIYRTTKGNLRMQIGDSPILLLDDVLPELDRSRRSCLLESITSFQQVLITATELDYFSPSFLAQAEHFGVSSGTVERNSDRFQ